MVPPPALAASADRQALVPMVAGYLILMAALAFGLWRMYRPGAKPRISRPLAGQGAARPGAGPAVASPEAGQADGPPPGAQPPAAPPAGRARSGRAMMARMVISTVAGGYVLLMATVVAYYYGVARVAGNFLESAVTGPLLLVGLTTPLYAAASWLTERRWRHRPGRPGSMGHRPE